MVLVDFEGVNLPHLNSGLVEKENRIQIGVKCALSWKNWIEQGLNVSQDEIPTILPLN